ncbi:type II toxin-antitoxin system PemK/MazF family toxin [uncultured Roseibium sp.]|uniref:type II toxin-antitoxin system PemK/MazF family toxin n=1 Tax=uncultured Roseibium sp. TaxID=1936171 RepID=UPI003447E97F
MALKFFPKAGQIYYADFSDLSPPEICKKRPVIVISPKLPGRSNLAAIVPISLSAPVREVPYVYKLSRNYHPREPDDLDCWAKADLVMNISLGRMDCIKVGRRRYEYPQLTPEDLLGVRRAVLAGLGLDKIIEK